MMQPCCNFVILHIAEQLLQREDVINKYMEEKYICT